MGFDDRSAIILGQEGLGRLRSARVAVYGLGGVGAACAMDLVRCGIGALVVVDHDEIKESNLNRLCIGYRSNLGQPKAQAFARLAQDVNPDCRVEPLAGFLCGRAEGFGLIQGVEAHVDAIDSLGPKVSLIASLVAASATFISCMGMAGRLRPECVRHGSLWESRGCPLARQVRQRLRRLGVLEDRPIHALWSEEEAVAPIESDSDWPRSLGRPRKSQGSLPFVPQAAGHLAASLIVRQILGISPA